jgi:hypothetical protein
MIEDLGGNWFEEKKKYIRISLLLFVFSTSVMNGQSFSCSLNILGKEE